MIGVSLIISLRVRVINPLCMWSQHICRSEGCCEHPFAAAFFVSILYFNARADFCQQLF